MDNNYFKEYKIIIENEKNYHDNIIIYEHIKGRIKLLDENLIKKCVINKMTKKDKKMKDIDLKYLYWKCYNIYI